VKIRPAKPSDREELIGLIAAFRVALAKLRGRRVRSNRRAAEKELSEYEEKKFPIFVAPANEGCLAGYLVCRVDGRTVWAESLFVQPAHRRKGIASALYARAERLAKSLGGKTVFNWVHPDNEGIIAFLRRRGYDVLNLIELRRRVPREKAFRSVRVGQERFRY
jgi:GNAT superfamily N-acetyltransferase